MQDVLVRITDATDFGREARAAARFAAGLGGRLTGLHTVQQGMPPTFYDAGLLAAEWAGSAQREVRAAREQAPRFAEWGAKMGLRSAVLTASAGAVPDMLAYAAAWHDVLVLEVDRDADDPWRTPGGIARIVLEVDAPCLVLPRGIELETPCDTVAIAWNGSLEAIRALHDALPLLADARRVVVLVGELKPASGLQPDFDLRRWLGERVPNTEYRPIEPGRPDGEAILEAAKACGAELLVMGAYGRSRAAEWLLGGVTRHVLQAATLPVLMRH